MSIWDWQNSSSVVRIQNKNYVGIATQVFFENFKLFRGCVPDRWYSDNTGISWADVIDTTVRIPGRIEYGGQTYATLFLNRGETFGNIRSGGTRVLGISISGERSSEVLPYMPRLYVELMPVADFVNNILTPRGITNYYDGKFMWSYYSNPPFGRSLIPVDKSILTRPLNNQYVLVKAGIYTNNPGSTQTLLTEYGYEYSTRAKSRYYDTFIPIDFNGTGQASINTALAMQPYIGSLMPYLFNANGKDAFTDYGNYTVGNAGEQGDFNGVTFQGVNYIMGTQSGNISPNPFYAIQKVMDYNAPVVLDEFPRGNSACFVIADMATWKKVLSGSGMAWSDVLDDVISPDDSKLHKPTYPGQPENPTGGGGGDGDNISDDIPLPNVQFFPNNNAYNRYWLTPAQVVDFQNWIFNKTFLDNILRLWNDPAEYLINLTFYPFNGYLHDVNNVQSGAKLSIGNLSSDISCVAMLDGYNPVFQGGTFTVTEYYGTYLDYAPYTTAEIYIPYIGYRNLNINDIMGKTLSLRYVVDWDTNTVTATLLVDENPLTMYTGNFGVKLALSGTNANQLAETIVQGAISTVVSMAGVVGSVAGTAAAVSTGNFQGAMQGAASSSSAMGGLVNGAIDTVMNTQVHPRYYGQPTPATGLYNAQVPHIIFHRPITAEPADYKNLHGYAAGYSGKISEFSGYLQCNNIKLTADNTISAAEQTEIINMLKGGIFV